MHCTVMSYASLADAVLRSGTFSGDCNYSCCIPRWHISQNLQMTAPLPAHSSVLCISSSAEGTGQDAYVLQSVLH